MFYFIFYFFNTGGKVSKARVFGGIYETFFPSISTQLTCLEGQCCFSWPLTPRAGHFCSLTNLLCCQHEQGSLWCTVLSALLLYCSLWTPCHRQLLPVFLPEQLSFVQPVCLFYRVLCIMWCHLPAHLLMLSLTILIFIFILNSQKVMYICLWVHCVILVCIYIVERIKQVNVLVASQIYHLLWYKLKIVLIL